MPKKIIFVASLWGLILTATYPEGCIDWCIKMFIDETVVQRVADFIMLSYLGKLVMEIDTEFKNTSKKNISHLILKVVFQFKKDFAR